MTGVHDCSGNNPTTSGGVEQDGEFTTWTRNWTGTALNGVVLVELIKSSTYRYVDEKFVIIYNESICLLSSDLVSVQFFNLSLSLSFHCPHVSYPVYMLIRLAPSSSIFLVKIRLWTCADSKFGITKCRILCLIEQDDLQWKVTWKKVVVGCASTRYGRNFRFRSQLYWDMP